MSADDRLPLDSAEAEFGSWLATLDSTTAPPAARAQAAARLAAAFLGERLANTRLTRQWEEERAEVKRLRQFENSVKSVVLEFGRETRELERPQTSVPVSPPQLRIVPLSVAGVPTTFPEGA